MADINQQIEEIQEVLRKTPHHKATNGFIGAMRAKISRLKDQQAESSSKGGGGGSGYNIKKQGDATIVLIGPPSAGKSTLINLITNAESKVAAYAFTTVSVIPGMLKYKDAYIQILDVPGLIEGASIGKGRGREVLSVARGADLLVLMTDINRLGFLDKLVSELETAGIRINKQRPGVRVEKKISGGLSVRTNFKQEFDTQTVVDIASEFGIKNGDITIKEKITTDQLIDSMSKRIVYKPAVFVVNKADLKKGKRYDDLIYISADKNEGVEGLKERIWNSLNLVPVYLVERDEKPNKEKPMIMNSGDTLSDLANKIGTEFAASTTLAKIWGNGAKFEGQEMPLSTRVQDGMMVRFI
jgi:ribosome-interacting GTPase 1